MSKYIPIESLYAALDFIEKSAVKGEEEKVRCITKAIRDIKFVPADVEKVVRCKDCKYADLFYPYCTIWEAAIDGDGYCYKGEKE